MKHPAHGAEGVAIVRVNSSGIRRGDRDLVADGDRSVVRLQRNMDRDNVEVSAVVMINPGAVRIDA